MFVSIWLFRISRMNNKGSCPILPHYRELSVRRLSSERSGFWINFRNLLTSELVFFTVLAFFALQRKHQDQPAVFKPSVSPESLISKFKPSEKFGSDTGGNLNTQWDG